MEGNYIIIWCHMYIYGYSTFKKALVGLGQFPKGRVKYLYKIR
jgi:hypothetical protein